LLVGPAVSSDVVEIWVACAAVIRLRTISAASAEVGSGQFLTLEMQLGEVRSVAAGEVRLPPTGPGRSVVGMVNGLPLLIFADCSASLMPYSCDSTAHHNKFSGRLRIRAPRDTTIFIV
jgi:hypothetical protein